MRVKTLRSTWLKTKFKTKKKGQERGQLMAGDFILATIILIFIVSTAMFAWNRNVYLLREKNERTEIRKLGLSIGNMLVKSPGAPSDWDSTNVKTIGLVDRPNVLNDQKVIEFNSMGKAEIQRLLGIRGYDFSFRVRAVNDTVLSDYGSGPSGQRDVIIVRRLVVYGNSPVYVEFGLWEE